MKGFLLALFLMLPCFQETRQVKGDDSPSGGDDSVKADKQDLGRLDNSNSSSSREEIEWKVEKSKIRGNSHGQDVNTLKENGQRKDQRTLNVKS